MKTRELILWMLAGLGLRLPLIPNRFLWYDESFTGLLTRQPLPALLAGTAADVHPPLYYLLIWPIQQWLDDIGGPLWTIRLPSLAAGLLSIWLMSQAARALDLDDKLSRALVIITALAPAQIWYASEARQYALLTALVLAGAWAVGARRWGWFNLAALGMVYTHNYGLFYAASLAALGFIRNPRDVFGIARAAIFTFAAWLPWGLVMHNQISAIDGRYWLEAIGHGPITTSIVVLLAGFDLSGTLMLAAGVLGITLLMLGLIQRPPLALLMLGVFPLVLAAVTSVTVTNLWLFRGLIPAQPWLMAIAIWPFIRVWEESRAARWLGAGLVLPVLLAGLVSQQVTGYTRADDAAGASLAVIRAGWQPGDMILHMTDGSAVHLGLKAPDLPQSKLMDCAHTVGALSLESRAALGMREVASIELLRLNGVKRVWLASGVGINTPPCMAYQTAAIVGNTQPAHKQPFKDYFVDEIYLVDLGN